MDARTVFIGARPIKMASPMRAGKFPKNTILGRLGPSDFKILGHLKQQKTSPKLCGIIMSPRVSISIFFHVEIKSQTHSISG